MFKHRYFISLKWSAQFGVFLGVFFDAICFRTDKKKAKFKHLLLSFYNYRNNDLNSFLL